MAVEPKTIIVQPGSELDTLLEQTETPLLLERRGVRYRLDREGTEGVLRDEPDMAAAVASIRAAAGSWQDIDAEAFKAYIAERRRRSSRPPIHL